MSIKNSSPVVSVIIPAYNCAATIEKSIDSALNQGVDLEVLIIDDASSDHLHQVLEKYREDERVIYKKNEKNEGVCESRNKGIALARGEYIAFLDADDWWDSEKLEKQLKLMEDSGAVICCTGRELISPDGQETGRMIPVKKRITYRELLKHNSINCSSVLIRSDVMRQYKMEHEDSHEDYILWLKILKKYGYACAVKEPLLKYRLSSKGKSGAKWKSAWMTYKVYRYAGFPTITSVLYFCRYVFQGIKKYCLAYLMRSKK